MSGDVIDLFRKNGYTVEETEVIGVSGVKHHFILLHSKDDDVVVEFSDRFDAEADLAKLVVKCRDSGISHAMLILKTDADLNDRMRRVAEENEIKIVRYSELKHEK